MPEPVLPLGRARKLLQVAAAKGKGMVAIVMSPLTSGLVWQLHVVEDAEGGDEAGLKADTPGWRMEVLSFSPQASGRVKPVSWLPPLPLL